MEKSSKPRVLIDYAKVSTEVKQQIKLHYPEGFETNLIKFPNKDGLIVSALPFETEDTYYLIRMTVMQAQSIIDDDDDYDDDGYLRDEIREEYEENLQSDMIEEEEFDDEEEDSYDDDSYQEDDDEEEDDED